MRVNLKKGVRMGLVSVVLVSGLLFHGQAKAQDATQIYNDGYALGWQAAMQGYPDNSSLLSGALFEGYVDGYYAALDALNDGAAE